MNADDFRDLYEYHFALNRKLWDACVVPLSQDQFMQPVEYGVGSVRNQVVHMLNIDERWFSGLRREALPDYLDPEPFTNRDEIRAKWDGVEARMREYLSDLRDEKLRAPALDDEPMRLWQLLLHIVNHGTDHRAQLLMILNGLGVKTFPQDYVIYLWDRG